jgi:hypothetical protein
MPGTRRHFGVPAAAEQPPSADIGAASAFRRLSPLRLLRQKRRVSGPIGARAARLSGSREGGALR